MFDVFIGGCLVSYNNADRVTHNVAHQNLHILFHCCREKEGLSVRSGLANYGADLLLKAQGQHPICFVQHQVCHTHQVCGLLPEEFYETARGRDQDVGAGFQGFPLLVLVLSAQQAVNFDTLLPGVASGLHVDLLAEFSGGG